VAKRKSIVNELIKASEQADRNRQRKQREAARSQAAAEREAARAVKDAERALAAEQRAAAADQKAAEKEAKAAYEAARRAEVEALNAELAAKHEELDTLLAATLDVDDFFDVEALRASAEHPPFEHAHLETPIPAPELPAAPDEPQWVEPEAPKALFGKAKKHAALREQAGAVYWAQHAEWEATVAALPDVHAKLLADHATAEAERQSKLAEHRGRYEAECAARELEAQKANLELEDFIERLAAGEAEAVTDYATFVLASSSYPDFFPVTHEVSFDGANRELTVAALIPAPTELPTEREFKWVKAKDEVAATAATQKDLKERYANVVCQVALRTMHEVFEADRAGHAATVSLVVATDHIDVATGQPTRTPLCAVAADRATFTSFDLTNVVPAATLELLHATVSSNPYGLKAIDTSKGVRG